MGRLRKLSPPEAVRILEQHGFVFVRQRGSHRMLQRRLEGSTITVPIPMHRGELPTGTLRAIIQRSGLPRSLFEDAE